MMKIKTKIKGKTIFFEGKDEIKIAGGNWHCISFTPTPWETIKKIWGSSGCCQKFVSVAILDKQAVLRVYPKENNMSIGICSGWRGAKNQFLFMDFDWVKYETVIKEFTSIILKYGMKRGLIIKSRPELKIVRVIKNVDGENFYDFDRENAYRKLIGDDYEKK